MALNSMRSFITNFFYPPRPPQTATVRFFKKVVEIFSNFSKDEKEESNYFLIIITVFIVGIMYAIMYAWMSCKPPPVDEELQNEHGENDLDANVAAEDDSGLAPNVQIMVPYEPPNDVARYAALPPCATLMIKDREPKPDESESVLYEDAEGKSGLAPIKPSTSLQANNKMIMAMPPHAVANVKWLAKIPEDESEATIYEDSIGFPDFAPLQTKTIIALPSHAAPQIAETKFETPLFEILKRKSELSVDIAEHDDAKPKSAIASMAQVNDLAIATSSDEMDEPRATTSNDGAFQRVETELEMALFKNSMVVKGCEESDDAEPKSDMPSMAQATDLTIATSSDEMDGQSANTSNDGAFQSVETDSEMANERNDAEPKSAISSMAQATDLAIATSSDEMDGQSAITSNDGAFQSVETDSEMANERNDAEPKSAVSSMAQASDLAIATSSDEIGDTITLSDDDGPSQSVKTEFGTASLKNSKVDYVLVEKRDDAEQANNAEKAVVSHDNSGDTVEISLTESEDFLEEDIE